MLTVRPVGQRALLFEVPAMADVHRLWNLVRSTQPAGVEDAVAGARSLLVVLGEDADPEALTSLLSGSVAVPPTDAGPPPARTVTIPVVYDGPDLAAVADQAEVAVTEVGQLHSARTYTVGFLGFSPGFAYLFGGDPRLVIPRLDSPRRSVPAGSVAVAADMTAVYPQATPGGWNLIGRTDVAMFDPRRSEPALLAPGDQVRFKPVDDVGPPPASALRPSALRPSLLRTTARPTAATFDSGPGAIEVRSAGPLLTIQDLGRPGWAHAGVPVGGAADMGSALRANHLAGNPPGAAVLEVTLLGSALGGCRLRLRIGLTVAVTGAPAEVTVDGLPARRDVALPLPAGSELAVGPGPAGVRAYIAVAGGIAGEPVLGSLSSDTLSGLGPATLRPGDVLEVGARPGGTSGPSAAAGTSSPPAARPIPDRDAVLTVTARWGPRDDRLTAEGRDTLLRGVFAVALASDRTGVRLDGPVVTLAGAGQVPSEGVVAGCMQLPPGGRPIVLMRNHPATGGYPVVAVVDDSGVDALAQAAPGQRINFALSD